ncbi:MAG: tetratricopeptide repeat protein [Crocinitomicaceae bacterium]|nr:tetratricopeptide repeat protein [Flavobacteriales bacterium]NQZ36195.1 tetratricopeptide repeat protein [Crocinitomicaceae bacterium]
MAELNGDLGSLEKVMGNNDKALFYHLKSSEICKNNELKTGLARAKINIGEIYEVQGNYRRSLIAFQEALLICEEYNLNGYKSSVYENLGNINLTIKEYKTAEKYYNKALKFALLLQNKNREIQSLKNLGKLYQELNRLPEALDYYNQGLKIAVKTNAVSLSANLNSNIASVYLEQNDLQIALRFVLESIELYKNHTIQENLAEAYLISAQIYESLLEFDKSRAHYQSSYDLVLNSGKISVLKMTSLKLAEVYEKNGNHPMSVQYYKEYIRYLGLSRDEDDVKEIIRMELQTKYHDLFIVDSLEKVNEIELLGIKHERREEKSLLNSYIAYGGLGALSLVLLFVGHSFVQKKRSTALLKSKNTLINQALDDKEILLKEVHHRVKNNMQVVSALLDLKSMNVNSEQAKAALEDSRSRIDAMQLAHLKMYQKGNYKQINITEYCQDIVTLLLIPIQREQDFFDVKGNDLWVDVELAQAVGFVIHELITNSIKHAWNESDSRRIELSINQFNNEIRLEYSDNGKGIPADFNIATAKSFGMKLIHSLVVRQLKGTIELKHEKGVNVVVKFETR